VETGVKSMKQSPALIENYLHRSGPELELESAVGNRDLLGGRTLALFCSVKCPGKIILQAYDLAVRLRDRGVSVISGFHSPMEKECLEVLLRGSQPLIICPARSIEKMRIPPEWKKPLDDGRLLIVSPFKSGGRRPTTQMALERNRFVASLASKILIAYAEPGSKTEAFCREVLDSEKPVYTLDTDHNRNLVEMGAKPVGIDYEF
jgi:predicted Rossmann fold nucleotide-binding protein DprA/Smf involved in DNA uptake